VFDPGIGIQANLEFVPYAAGLQVYQGWAFKAKTPRKNAIMAAKIGELGGKKLCKIPDFASVGPSAGRYFLPWHLACRRDWAARFEYFSPPLQKTFLNQIGFS
jgi:hypothetical protein